MALPWLIGAAAVATVGYLASKDDDDYDDDDDYYDSREEARKRERKLKKREFKIAKSNFLTKWEVKYKEDSDESPKIKKLILEEDKIKNEIKELLALELEIERL